MMEGFADEKDDITAATARKKHQKMMRLEILPLTLRVYLV
jgi:hypothetical protein